MLAQMITPMALTELQMNPLLTSKDVADALRVSLRKFEQMVQGGEAPRHIFIGRQRRWRLDDIQAWVDVRFQADLDDGTEGGDETA